MFLKIYIDQNKYIIVGNIYRPNTGTLASISASIDYIEEILGTIYKNKDFNKAADVILLGDFNVNSVDYNCNTLVSKFIDCFISNNQLPITLHPTRLASRTATLLDFFAIKNIDNEFQTGIITTSLADHFPIYYSFKIDY